MSDQLGIFCRFADRNNPTKRNPRIGHHNLLAVSHMVKRGLRSSAKLSQRNMHTLTVAALHTFGGKPAGLPRVIKLHFRIPQPASGSLLQRRLRAQGALAGKTASGSLTPAAVTPNRISRLMTLSQFVAHSPLALGLQKLCYFLLDGLPVSRSQIL